MKQFFEKFYKVSKKKLTKLASKMKKDGTVVVFFSSPFGGCEDERKVLLNKTYVKLSKLCENKGIFLSFIDLRW